MFFLAALSGAWLGAHAANAAFVDYYWNITYVNANPDGLFPRQVIGVNNTWPPPPVVMTQGDVLRMHAHNGLDRPTTLHHHGMYFNSTSYFDGALGVTQCGIPPGEDFVYEVDTTTQVGTYWVHAHATGQYVDGLRAPVTILPRNASALYQDEYTVSLADWYHDSHDTLAAAFMSKANPGGAEPVPKSALIYFSTASLGNATYLPGISENASLPLAPGRTYRLRIVNMSAFAMFFFKIDGHRMSVIEADGIDVEPYEVDSLTLTVAQRYSVLVTGLTNATTNYAIQANFNSDMFDVVPEDLPLNYTATIEYNPSFEVATPTDFTPEMYMPTNDTAFVPIEVQPTLHKTSTTIELNAFFDTFENGVNRAAFNNITYVPPVVPTMMTIESMGSDVSNPAIYGPQTNAILLNHLDVIELRVVNWDAGGHPFHLHGHVFQIVGRQDDVTVDPAEIDESQANPMRRDTVQIPSMGSVTLRFVADNPGVWFFHCHIDWHLTAGLAVTFISAPELIHARSPVPQFMLDQCATLKTPYIGNAAGRLSTTDLSGAAHGPYPQNPGFHSKGIGAMAACILSAIIGVATIVWYATGEQFEEEEMEEEERERQEAKAAKKGQGKGSLFGRIQMR